MIVTILCIFFAIALSIALWFQYCVQVKRVCVFKDEHGHQYVYDVHSKQLRHLEFDHYRYNCKIILGIGTGKRFTIF